MPKYANLVLPIAGGASMLHASYAGVDRQAYRLWHLPLLTEGYFVQLALNSLQLL